MAQARAALFPGSFDPLTKGHTDIARRALAIFGKLTVGVLHNLNKQTLFTVEERIDLIQREFADCGARIEVVSFSGLLVNFAQSLNVPVIIRGLRAVSDFDYEAQLALMNRNLCEQVETFFLMTREENSYISSTLVKQIAQFGGDVSKFVPAVVAEALQKKVPLLLRKV
jgi:pantetheine-phosphate adenylyltransferase